MGSSIKLVADRRELAVGGALVLAGITVVVTFALTLDAEPSTWWALGALATAVVAPALLILGTLTLCLAWQEGCAACGRPLAEVTIPFPDEAGAAVAEAGEARPMALARLAHAAEPGPAGASWTLRAQACPRCQRVGRVAASRSGGGSPPGGEEPRRPVELSPWSVRQLLDLAALRRGVRWS